jgi:hypothetical protein
MTCQGHPESCGEAKIKNPFPSGHPHSAAWPSVMLLHCWLVNYVGSEEQFLMSKSLSELRDILYCFLMHYGDYYISSFHTDLPSVITNTQQGVQLWIMDEPGT